VDRRSKNIIVYVDSQCDVSLKWVMILKTLLILPQLQVEKVETSVKAKFKNQETWLVQKPNGDYVMKESALVWLVSRSCLFFWLKWPLLAMKKFNNSDKGYQSRRPLIFERFFAKALPWQTSNGKISWLNHSLAALFFVLVLHINLKPVIASSYLIELPSELRNLTNSLGLWQKWDMFAPYPMTVTRWPVYEGITYSGRKVDIFRQEFTAPIRGKPENILDEYTNHRWRKFYTRLYMKKFNYYRASYVKFECRRWNHKQRAHPDRIKKINLSMGNEKTLLDASQEVSQLKSMGSYWCGK
jgi:hypothetical protein